MSLGNEAAALRSTHRLVAESAEARADTVAGGAIALGNHVAAVDDHPLISILPRISY